MKKIQNIQALRGIAVFMVILYHFVTIEEKYGNDNIISPSFFSLGIYGVDLFFIISGFIMVWVTQTSFQNINKIKRFLYHRATRIYPTYWFFTTIILIVFLIKPSMINNAHGNKADIIESFLLIPYKNALLLNVAWTLVYEMFFYFIFTIILFFKKEFLLYIAPSIVLGLVLLNIVVPNYTVDNIYISFVYSPYFIEFFIGVIIGLTFIYQDFKKYKYVMFGFISLLFIISIFNGDMNGYRLDVWNILMISIPLALFFYLMVLAEIKYKIILPTIVQYIGNASYSIYLSHISVLSVLGLIWRKMYLNDFSNILMFVIMIPLTIISGYIFYKIIEKPVLKISHKIEKKYFNWS